MSFLKLSKQCAPTGTDCLTAFDPTDCIDETLLCVRTASTCGDCTCLQLGLEPDSEVQDPFHWCYCEFGEGHKSLDGTMVITKFGLHWPDDSGVTDADLAALAATVCEAPADVIWKIWGRGSMVPCAKATATWTPVPISLDGGLSFNSFVTNPPVGSVFTLFTGPKLEDGFTDIFDCTDQPYAAYLVQIFTSCGALLVLCPEGGASNTVLCTPSPICCCLVFGDCFTTPCEAGMATVHWAVHGIPGQGTCECSFHSASISISKDGVVVDTFDLTGGGIGQDSSGSFEIACDGTDGEFCILILEMDIGCSGCDATICPAAVCLQVYLDGSGVVQPITCLS